MVGFIYPLYASIKAIESKTNDDDTLWLTYWIIFSMFKIFEGVADFLVSFIPFYFFFKVAFLIYCYNPTSKGAETVYNLVVKPYVVPLIMGTDFAKKEN
jgi:receptor expression-enhancing protein 5/6